MRHANRLTVLFAGVLFLGLLPSDAYADSPACFRGGCTDVQTTEEALEVSYITAAPGGSYAASNHPPVPQPYRYRLRTPCEVDTAAGDICRPDDDALCPAPPDRVVRYVVLERQRLVISGDPALGRETTTVDGVEPGPAPLGSPVGSWQSVMRTCVDITALNPPPSPDEVYRYFQTLPLPQLPTRHQPPGDGLTGLPVVFHTDGPTTQNFTPQLMGAMF